MPEIVQDRNAKGRELRDVVVQTIQSLMTMDDRVVALEADLGGASHFTKIGESNPLRFVQCGISEANMMGVAAGMSSEGFKPYVHTFSPFATRRAFDQIYLSGAYARNTINIYGSDPGFTVGPNGGTHTSWEDVALMRTIPGAVVVDAADDVQMEWVIREFSKIDGIHYVRANRKAVRNIYAHGSVFELGHGVVVRPGSDVLVISAGQLVSEALDAADLLALEGVNVEVIDMFTIKPLDADLVLAEMEGKEAVITFENHGVIGGLGSAVAEVLAESGRGASFRRHGVTERFGQVGTPAFLQKEYGLESSDLVDDIRKMLAQES